MERARSGRPLLAPSARPRAGVLLAGCAVLVAVLGVLFAHQSTADPFDRAVDSWVIAGFDGHPALALRLASPGTTIPAIVLSVVIAGACLISGRLRGAVLAVAAVPATVGLCEVLVKPLVHRTYIGQVAYPSGHTATVFALVATLTVLLLTSPRPAMPRWLRIVILAVVRVYGPGASSTRRGAASGGLASTYLTAAAVVIGVIAVRFHYFTDTVAGAAVGIGTVMRAGPGPGSRPARLGLG